MSPSGRRDRERAQPLGLLLPGLHKGRSFVNLPPPSRIEQNALLFHGPLSHRVGSDRLVHHMRPSPPDSPAAREPASLLHTPKRAATVRTAPSRSPLLLRLPSRHSPRMSVPNVKPSATAQWDELQPASRPAVRPSDEEDEEEGRERILLGDEGCSPKAEELDAEDVEAARGRPVRAANVASTAAATQHDKTSLKSSLKLEDSILRLSIGGSSYRIRTRSILKHGADTLLGRFVRMNEQHRRAWADAYFEEEGEYFFERVPRYFDPIYDFYASGKLHVPKDLCFDKFMAELRFWAVSKAKMDDCCSPFAQYCLIKRPHRLETPADALDEELPRFLRRPKLDPLSVFASSVPEPIEKEKDHFIGLRCAKLRRRLWLILEGHSRSKWWKFFEITSTSFVVLSITALILASMPEFQVPDTSGQVLAGPGANYPTYPKVSGHIVSTTTVVKDADEHRVEMVEHPVFNYVENICVVYFTLEYLLRFWVSPLKVQFVREFLNVIDLLAIAPFVFELVLVLVGIREDNVRKVRWAFLTMRLLRILRVVRIAKLGRFSPGLANFALTLRKSKKQMQMVAIVLLTVIIFFSTLVYFLEKDEPNTTFTSIPAAFWWCLFSQTKWVPQTAGGKIVGGGAITCGVLVLALPIAILVNNFMQVVRLREEKVMKQYATIGSGQHGGGTGDRV